MRRECEEGRKVGGTGEQRRCGIRQGPCQLKSSDFSVDYFEGGTKVVMIANHRRYQIQDSQHEAALQKALEAHGPFTGGAFIKPHFKQYFDESGETVESLHVLHEVTGDPMYREWGWHIFESIEKYCKAKHGFGHLTDVRNTARPPEDKMESFFVAETLKYHFLLQTPGGNGVTLQTHVFNTEAHPLPLPTSQAAVAQTF